MKVLMISVLFFLSVACTNGRKESKKDENQREAVALDGIRKIVTKGLPRGFSQRDYTVTRDGETAYTTIQVPGGGRSFVVRVDLGTSVPSLASFSGKYNDLEPMLADDDHVLLFASDRPLNRQDSTRDFNIWYCRIQDGKLSEPAPFDSLINTAADEFYPSMNNRGDLYFTAKYHGRPRDAIYVSTRTDSGYTRSEMLSFCSTGRYYNFNAWISPDDRYILFTSYGRDGEYGGGDLCISIKDSAGVFQDPEVLNNEINSKGADFSPFVKGDTLFYTSRRIDQSWEHRDFKYLSSIQMHADSVATGEQNIYMTLWDSGEWINNQDEK